MGEIVLGWLDSIRIQLGALAGTYGLATCVFLLLRWQVGERWPVIALSNNMMPWILLGSLVSFVVALLALDKPFWMLYNVPGIVMLVVWYGPLFIPTNSAEARDGLFELTVVTYNIAGGYRYPDELLEEIVAMDADIVGMQEVRPAFFERLQEEYPYGLQMGEFAVVSRYPIDEELSFVLREGDAENVRIVGLRTVVTVQEQPIVVYVVHPTRPTLDIRLLEYDAEALHQAIRVVASSLEQEVRPIILLCDCNTSDKNDDYQLLEKFLYDGWVLAGRGFGFTAPANNWFGMPYLLMRGDYVWFSAHFGIEEIKVLPGQYSDHLPVWAKLELVVSTLDNLLERKLSRF